MGRDVYRQNDLIVQCYRDLRYFVHSVTVHSQADLLNCYISFAGFSWHQCQSQSGNKSPRYHSQNFRKGTYADWYQGRRQSCTHWPWTERVDLWWQTDWV